MVTKSNQKWLPEIDQKGSTEIYPFSRDAKKPCNGEVNMKANLKLSKALKKHYGWLIPPTVAVITTIAVTSCTKSAPKNNGTLSESDIQMEVTDGRADIANGAVAKGQAKLQDAADKYARMGELLLMPEGFQYADEMFGKALELDPNNNKANFYKAVTEPAMLGKGFIPRIERLLTEENNLRDVEKLRQDIEKLDMPELSDFAKNLPANEKAFLSYYDVQRFERERLLPALKVAADRLSKIDVSKTPLELRINPDRLKTDPVRRESSYSYQYEYCNNNNGYFQCQENHYNGSYGDPKLPTVYHVDKHDLKIIQSSYSAMIAAVQVGTAYSHKDIEFAIRRLKGLTSLRENDDYQRVTAEDVTNLLREFPELFTLEKDNELAQVAGNVSAVLKNALSFNDLKSELCKGKARTTKNALFVPICLTSDMVDSLKLGVDLLAGPKEIVLGQDSSNRDVRIMVDLTKILKTPPADLKALLPVSFDDNGNPVNYPDTTMGGLFPNGDIIEKLKKVAGQNLNDKIGQSLDDAAYNIKHVNGRF